MSAPRTADSGEILHAERLTPSAGAWIVAFVFASLFGVVLVPLGLVIAAAVGVAAVIIMAVVLVVTSPVIEVTDQQLRAGRAQIGREHVGTVTALDRDAWQRAMSTGFDPRDFHLTRGWVATGVRVQITDPADPTPAWQLSTRRPEDLVLALTASGSPGREGAQAEHSLQ